jgi:uncharacterized protein (DUF58 family)
MFDALRARIAAAAADTNAVWPTVSGVWFGLVLAGVLFGAVNTGNNLVYIVLAAMMGVLLINNFVAEWNLRGLIVRRALPGELFADEPATGRYVVENPKRFGTAWRVEVGEQGAGGARALFATIGPRQTREVPAQWTFPRRGVHQLGRIRLASRHPFGLILRFRDLDVPDEVLVYPAPADGHAGAGGDGTGDLSADRSARDATGDFAGLRPYEAGDPVRRIHWRSTARTGSPLVALRTSDAGGRVVVRVERRTELDISRACGEVLHHVRRGDAVGLDVEGLPERIAPRAGAAQRRRLLATLARLDGAGA